MKIRFAIPFLLLLLTSLVGCGMTNTAIENDRPDNIDVTDETLGNPPTDVNDTGNGINNDTGTGTGTEDNDEDYLDNTNPNENMSDNENEFNLPGTGG